MVLSFNFGETGDRPSKKLKFPVAVDNWGEESSLGDEYRETEEKRMNFLFMDKGDTSMRQGEKKQSVLAPLRRGVQYWESWYRRCAQG